MELPEESPKGADQESNFLEKTREQYAALGEFIAEFEQICHAMRQGIVLCLDQNGFHKQSISRILLGHSAMTAKPLFDVYRAILAEEAGKGLHIDAVANEIGRRFQSLVEKRNQFVHGTWFIGWGSQGQTDFSDFWVVKDHVSKSGYSMKDVVSRISEVTELTREARRLTNLFHRLNGALFPMSRRGRSGDEFIRVNFKTLNGKCVPIWAEDDGPWPHG